MCHGDGKMRWQIGGNVEPVKTICELNWHECPGAILNYIWSEIVTDVVECLSSETMLWRVLATFVVCTLVAHTVYYKIRWMDETAMNRENLNRVGFKVQDLELKVNILTYKMQYGAWPLPRDFHGTEFEENELHKLKLTLSNSKQRNGWIKHLLLSPKQNGRSFMPHSNNGSKSVECLARLINLETKYMPSQFYQDTSPGGSNMARTSSSAILSEKLTRHTKVSTVESKNKFLSHHDASKNENVIARHRNIEKTKLKTKKWPTSDGDVNNETYANNLQTVSHGKLKKPFEKLIRVADDCRKFMKDVRTSDKSSRPIDSISSGSKNQNRTISQTARISENIEKEAAGDRHKITNERKREGGTRMEEENLHEESFENYSNASNFIALIRSDEEIKTSSPSVALVSKSDVGRDLKNTVDTNKCKLLPPNLSITLKMMSYPKPLSETKPETALEINEGLKKKIIQSKCEPKNTNDILHGVKDKLEDLHKALRRYDAQDDSKAAYQSKVESLKVISKMNDVMGSKVAMDLLNAEKNENMNKTSSKDTDKFSGKDETSSSNEKYDTNETTRSSDSSIHNECRLNIFSRDVTSADDNRQKLESNISNEGWTYENATTTEMKNECDDNENNKNNIIGSDGMINESERKIRNFYCLTSISNNASSASSRVSISGSARNTILVSEKCSVNRSENQVDWSSNIEEEINPKRKMTLQSKDEICSIKMETEEDTTMISQTSSQTEISNNSDLELESKTTVQLLQEALVYKKVLLSQMEMEKSTENFKDEKQMNNEENNNPSASDDLSWNKNENHFQLKLLDIISEEQSASSSTERTGKNSNKNCIKDRFQNDSNILTTCPSNDDRCKKSKDVLTMDSCEYFSLTDMQNSGNNLAKYMQNEDSVFGSKIGIKSKVEIKKINDTDKTDGSPKRTTYTINTSPVKTLNSIKKESQDSNDAILNKNEVSDKVYRNEEKSSLINSVNQLYVQQKQHVQNHNKVSLHSRKKGIEAPQEAMRQQEEDENLNMVQAPFERTSWNPTAESSSREGGKQLVNPLTDTKTKSSDIFSTGGTRNLKFLRSSGHNFSQNLNILSPQGGPGIFSLPDSKTLNTEDNLLSFDHDERLIDVCALEQYITSQENNLDTKCNIQSYSLNEALDENAMNLITLDKRNENDENSLGTNEPQDNSSPLTGRTVVLPMNNMFIDDCEETVERNIEIMPKIDVTKDLILLENTAPDLHSVKDEMDIVTSEAKRYTDCSALELSISENCSEREEEGFDNTRPTVNKEQISKNSMSNMNSQPSSLYFTDEASLSEIKLNSVCFLNLDVESAQRLKTKKNVANDNMLDIKNQTTAANKSMCIIDKLHDAERLHVKPVADDVSNTESINLESNEITQELDTEVLLNPTALSENKEGNEYKIHELNMKMNTSLRNQSNADEVVQNNDVSKKNENKHMCTADSNTEKLVLEPQISTANLNSDTSNSFVSASNQGIVRSNSINITLDRPILNSAINKSEISPVNKSARCSSASQLSRLPWSTRTTPLSSASSLKSKILEKPLLSKPEVIHSRRKTKCKSMDLKVSRNDNQQLSAKSHLSLRLDGPPTKYLSNQSGIEIPQRRSRSSVTPRKSQISPRDDNVDHFDNRGNQTSRSRDYTPRMAKKNLEHNVTTPKSKLKATTKTISKSCIPILKSRLESEKKLEPELRSKSPARGPMTITNSQVGGAPCCTLTQFEVMSDLLEGNIYQSQCLTEKEIEDHNEYGEIINVLELQDISEQYDHLKKINIPNNSSVGDSDRSIIYMNIVADHDHDHTATAVVDPKRLIKCVQGNELKVENIDKDKIYEDYESEKPTSINMDEHVSPVLTTALTVIDDNLLINTGETNSSKILITDETKNSYCIQIEHKEIEVSVKPSVTDTSTSISDLPNISREPRNLMEAFKVFEVPKELTKEEYIVLLETLNQDPNLVQFRRMQKLCSKLGLGFRE